MLNRKISKEEQVLFN